jgi:hypothetical protein
LQSPSALAVQWAELERDALGGRELERIRKGEERGNNRALPGDELETERAAHGAARRIATGLHRGANGWIGRANGDDGEQ